MIVFSLSSEDYKGLTLGKIYSLSHAHAHGRDYATSFWAWSNFEKGSLGERLLPIPKQSFFIFVGVQAKFSPDPVPSYVPLYNIPVFISPEGNLCSPSQGICNNPLNYLREEREKTFDKQ